jgi:predicted O-methyltransferase YrrM
VRPPAALAGITSESERIGFTMSSEPKTGSLLRTLAASKPSGRFLELGTGTGVAAAWLLDGMSEEAHLNTVDNNASTSEIARRHLGNDPRITFHIADGSSFLAAQRPSRFDFIFADAWPGKFSDLECALSLLKPGGLYVVDDLLPQPNWPAGHAPKVPALIAQLERQRGFESTSIEWASGLMILARR